MKTQKYSVNQHLIETILAWVKSDERIVKQNGKVKFEGKLYHVSKKRSNECVEVKITLRGVEAWHKGALIKLWKYLEFVLGIAAGYRLEKYLL